MFFENFIARRYLRASRANRFFSFITFMTIAGIAIGVAALITVLSVIDGFEDGLRERFLAANAHVLMYVYPTGLKNHENAARIIADKLSGEVTGVSPFVYYEAVVGRGYSNHPVIVRGIDPQKREAVQSLKSIVRPPEALGVLEKEMGSGTPAAPYSVILGSGVTKVIGAGIGDVIEMITPTSSGGRERSHLKIVGIYESGLNHYDRKLAIVSLSAGQVLFNMGELVTGLEIGLKDPDRSKVIADRLAAEYPSFSINEWQSFNRSMFQIVEKQRAVIGLLVFLVSMVASFNILSTMFVAVTQKQRDISLLRALGATNRQVLRIFLNQSVLMGVVGTVLGCLLAGLINYLLGNYEIIKLPDAYFLNKLPVKNDLAVYGGVALIALFLSMLAALGPSLVASRTSPTIGLSEKTA